MPGNTTNFNRPKKNLLISKRRSDRQRKASHGTPTIDSKKARQIKLMDRKLKRKQQKLALKGSKMVDEDEE